MSGKGGKKRERLLRRMEQLAEGRVNDAVKLAFLEDNPLEKIDGLDLTALTEFKRSGTGAVEIKLANRMGALERLVELYDNGEGDRAAAFFRALEGEVDREGTGGA